MDKNKKAAIAVGVVAVGTVLALALRAKAAPPGEEPPVGEAFFIMEGEAPRDTLWPLGLEVYSMRGVVKNIGSEPGSTEVMGWFTVGDSSQVYNICSELVTLGPNGTKSITCEISRDMLEAALEMEGHEVSYALIQVYLSTYDHVRYGTDYGLLYTQDNVYCYIA